MIKNSLINLMNFCKKVETKNKQDIILDFVTNYYNL